MSFDLTKYLDVDISINPIELDKHVNVLINKLGNSCPDVFKSGGKIHIKKKNRGKFTEYCGGKVTSECIAKGKRSNNPTTRKRATFAQNARSWNK